jgi:hypothetical protein
MLFFTNGEMVVQGPMSAGIVRRTAAISAAVTADANLVANAAILVAHSVQLFNILRLTHCTRHLGAVVARLVDVRLILTVDEHSRPGHR